MKKEQKSCVILFSGGVDSTYVATKVAEEFDRIVLNTYKVPGMVWVDRSKVSAAQLKKLYGEKIEHNIIDITENVNQIRGGALKCLKDNLKYKFFYSWCLGCKLVMHQCTKDFCRKENIDVVFDGSNAYDLHSLEQYEDVKEIFNSKVYNSNDINFTSPNYHEEGIKTDYNFKETLLQHLVIFKPSHNHRVAHLKSLSIDLGGKISNAQYRKCQPSCTTSLFFNGFRLFYKAIFKEKKEGYLRYVKEKINKNEEFFK